MVAPSLIWAWPWALAAAPLPLLALLLPAARPGVRPVRVPFTAALYSDGPATLRPRVGPSALLALLAWALLVTAAARPQWVGEPTAVPLSGRDLMLAVDISGSMGQRDMRRGPLQMTRLAVVKLLAGDFITRRRGDRVGLILFGTQPYLQAPLTFDRAAVRQLLEESGVGLAGRYTALGDAIGLAIKRLRDTTNEDRVLVLLTDGANTAGTVSPDDAARVAADAGLRVYTIGIGSPSRRRGNAGIDLDEDSLIAIANATGGQYFRARSPSDLDSIYRRIDLLEPAASDSVPLRPRSDWFYLPLGGAWLLAALAAIVHARPWRRQGAPRNERVMET